MGVPEEILQQLGGNKFIAMTGAKNFAKNGNKMHFSIPTSNKINSITIELCANDLYQMKFYNIKGIDITEISSFDDIYFDQLADIFEEQTGLRTSL